MNMQKGEGGQRDPVMNMIVWGGKGGGCLFQQTTSVVSSGFAG